MQTFPILLCHPNIPKPLHTLNPRTVKGSKWWNEVKAKSKAQFNDHCWTCGVHKSQARFRKWLEAHESYSINYSTGEVRYVGTCALCHACHNFIHDGRLISLINKNEYDYQQFEQIMEHGNSIIKQFVGSLGYQWTGGKKWQWVKDEQGFSVLEKVNALTDDYPFMRTHSKLVQWIGEPLAEWEDYHLIVEGEKFGRRFDTYDDWLAHYS